MTADGNDNSDDDDDESANDDDAGSSVEGKEGSDVNTVGAGRQRRSDLILKLNNMMTVMSRRKLSSLFAAVTSALNAQASATVVVETAASAAQIEHTTATSMTTEALEAAALAAAMSAARKQAPQSRAGVQRWVWVAIQILLMTIAFLFIPLILCLRYFLFSARQDCNRDGSEGSGYRRTLPLCESTALPTALPLL